MPRYKASAAASSPRRCVFAAGLLRVHAIRSALLVLQASDARPGALEIVAPKATPAEIVEKLNKEVNAALADPNMEKRLTDLGAAVFAGSPADFGKFIADEIDKWRKVVRFAGIKAE